jgi:hypothetical protein
MQTIQSWLRHAGSGIGASLTSENLRRLGYLFELLDAP